MTTRNRAWRRRRERTVLRRISETREWLTEKIQDLNARRIAALKPHRHGALTHVQERKLRDALSQAADDGFTAA